MKKSKPLLHAVEHWFGDGFTALHPLLQKLHRQGGELAGTVQVDYGQGLALAAAWRLSLVYRPG